MSKKQDPIAQLLAAYKPSIPLPASVAAGTPLVDVAVKLVLLRRLPEATCDAILAALHAAYADWNELRVSQPQEVLQHFPGVAPDDRERMRELYPAAIDLRESLQEIFQYTHGLDLEFLRQDASEGAKALASCRLLGPAGAGYVLWLASEGKVPISLVLARALDRLELIPRTSSLKKAESAILPLIPKGKELEFTLFFHEIGDTWSEEDLSIFDRFPALRELSAGKKLYEERLQAKARAEAAQKREDERRAKEEEKERKRQELIDKKRQAEEERLAKKRALAEEKVRKQQELEAARLRKKQEAEAARLKAIADREAKRKADAEAKAKAQKAALEAKELAKKKAAEKAAADKAKAQAAKEAALKKAAEKKAAELAKQKAAKEAAAKALAEKKAAEAKKAAEKKAAELAKQKAAKEAAALAKAKPKEPAAKPKAVEAKKPKPSEKKLPAKKPTPAPVAKKPAPKAASKPAPKPASKPAPKKPAPAAKSGSAKGR